MSFPENDRKVQSKKGKSFPNQEEHTLPPFAQAIGLALREEFGGGPSAVKAVARLARSNERAARNWFEGKNGPSGESLIRLLQQSDVVLRAVLDLAGRQDIRAVASLPDLRRQLLELVTAIDSVHR